MAWAHDTCDQLAAFDGRLPSLLAGWSIEKESQQWTQAIKDVPQHSANCAFSLLQ